jgi:TRAP-type C4-dicarboxylate transport system permease small subunit
MTFLVDRLSGSARLVADYFAFLVTLVFCGVFLWATGVQGFRALHDDTE